MRYSLIQRATVASCLAAAAASIGCGGIGGGETTGGGNTSGETTTSPSVTPPNEPPSEPPVSPPAAPVSSCSVANDVAISGGEASSPAVAFGGGHFAVAWTDLSHDGGDVVLTLVDTDGNKLHEQAIAAGAGAAVAPAVAALPGGGFLVAWQEIVGAGGTVRAVRVDDNGVQAGPAMTLATAGSHEAHPDVAATSKGAQITWTEATDAVIAEVKNDAVAGKLPLPGAAQAAIAHGAGGTGAVWTSDAQIGFARIGAGGGATNTSPNVVTFRSAPGHANIPRIAARPEGGFVVVWEDTRGGPEREAVFLATLDASGHVSGETQISPPVGSADYPDVAMVGDRAAVAYYQWRDGPSAIYLSLVEPGRGKIGEDLEISGKGSARYPRLAWGGAGNLGVAYAKTKGPVHLALVACK